MTLIQQRIRLKTNAIQMQLLNLLERFLCPSCCFLNNKDLNRLAETASVCQPAVCLSRWLGTLDGC